MARMMVDCRRLPSGSDYSLVSIGEEDEVARVATAPPVRRSRCRVDRVYGSRTTARADPRYSGGASSWV